MDKITFFQHYDQISECPLFKGMDSDDIGSVLWSDTTGIIQFKEGQFISPNALYIVLEGKILIEKQASDGRFVTMGRAETSAAINAAAIFLSTPPMSRMLALSDCSLLKLDSSTIYEAIEKGGKFAVNMVEFLAGRVCFLNKKITSFAGYSAAGRLHMYLEENSVDGEVVLPMSLSAFAEFLGVGRASLYRTLDQMEEEGMIKRSRRRISIINQHQGKE